MTINERVNRTIKNIAQERNINEDLVTWHDLAISLAKELNEVKSIDNPNVFPSDANENTKEGMTLRDYFAAKAMQGELSAQNFEIGGDWANEIDLAQRAYLIADAMLIERTKIK